MKEKNIEGTVESRVCFQELEDWVREKVQSWVQELLEEEETELLGRDKSERRGKVDPASGYRNGYGKARRLTLSSGTITVRRPRVRDLEERFESRVLPLFAKRTQQVRDLIPELYLHGLAQGDFDLALRGLLGGRSGLVGQHGGPTEREVARRMGRLAKSSPGGTGSRLFMGGWNLRQSGSGEGKGRPAGGPCGAQ